MPTPRPEVAALRPYVAPLEGRRGLLRLDFNENTVGPSPRVIEAIRELGPQDYATYPEYAGLEERFAAELSLPVERVAAFNGVDGAIRAVFDAFGHSGATFLTTAPTFGYYGPCAAQQGMRTVGLPYEGDDFSFPRAAFAEALAARPAIAFICNPNNPTGTLLPADEILALAAGAPETLVVVDELYVDFTGLSVLPQAVSHDNVLVLRSLSKSRGLAGLRLGFAVGPQLVLDALRKVTGPYDINAFAVTAALASLADREHMAAYAAEVKRAKASTVSALRSRQVRVHAAGGNYVLVWPGGGPSEASKRLEQTVSGLKAQGVLVRSMAGKPLIGDSFRLSIGTCDQMRRFLSAWDHLGV